MVGMKIPGLPTTTTNYTGYHHKGDNYFNMMSDDNIQELGLFQNVNIFNDAPT